MHKPASSNSAASAAARLHTCQESLPLQAETISKIYTASPVSLDPSRAVDLFQHQRVKTMHAIQVIPAKASEANLACQYISGMGRHTCAAHLEALLNCQV